MIEPKHTAMRTSSSTEPGPSAASSAPRHDALKAQLALQRLFACTSYAVSSVMLSLTNKGVFSDASFDFPLSVLASQALGTVLLLRLGGNLGISAPVVLDLPLLRAMVPITLLFAAMLGTSSRALRLNSVPVVTIFKNLSVVAVCVYEHFVFKQRITRGVFASLVVMLGGSAVAAIGDLHFSLHSLSWLLLNVLCTVCHIIAIRSWLSSCGASSAAKSFHNQLIALVVFLAAAAVRGESCLASHLPRPSTALHGLPRPCTAFHGPSTDLPRPAQVSCPTFSSAWPRSHASSS